MVFTFKTSSTQKDSSGSLEVEEHSKQEDDSEIFNTAENNGPDERAISSGSLEVVEHTEVLTTANNGLDERAMISSGSLEVVEHTILMETMETSLTHEDIEVFTTAENN